MVFRLVFLSLVCVFQVQASSAPVQISIEAKKKIVEIKDVTALLKTVKKDMIPEYASFIQDRLQKADLKQKIRIETLTANSFQITVPPEKTVKIELLSIHEWKINGKQVHLQKLTPDHVWDRLSEAFAGQPKKSSWIQLFPSAHAFMQFPALTPLGSIAVGGAFWTGM